MYSSSSPQTWWCEEVSITNLSEDFCFQRFWRSSVSPVPEVRSFKLRHEYQLGFVIVMPQPRASDIIFFFLLKNTTTMTKGGMSCTSDVKWAESEEDHVFSCVAVNVKSFMHNSIYGFLLLPLVILLLRVNNSTNDPRPLKQTCFRDSLKQTYRPFSCSVSVLFTSDVICWRSNPLWKLILDNYSHQITKFHEL